MNDPVYVYATYGPGMGFTLALGSDGDFAYSLSGNMGELFPLRRIGHWAGSDPKNVIPLRQNAIDLARSTPANAPPMPDSAFITIRHEGESVLTTGEYALYDPPAAISPFFDEMFRLIYGEWAEAALSVLQTECRPVAAAPLPDIRITLHSVGQSPVRFAHPLTKDIFSLMFMAPAGEDTVEPTASELRVTCDGSLPSDLFITLLPQDRLELMLSIGTELPGGSWDLRVAMALGPQPLAKEKIASGIITWGPFRVDVPAA